MWNISMAIPKGISKKDYQEMQELKAEEDFKYSFNQKIQNLEFAVNMINETLRQVIATQGSDKTDMDIQIDEVFGSVVSGIKEFRQTLGDFGTEIESMRTTIKILETQCKNSVSVTQLNEKISLLTDMIHEVSLDKEKMRSDLNNAINRIHPDVNVKLKALKQEIVSIPSEIPELKNSFNKQLELVELNSQNGVLRSCNNEKSIMLIERKIEQIYQIIKRLELSVQESK